MGVPPMIVFSHGQDARATGVLKISLESPEVKNLYSDAVIY